MVRRAVEEDAASGYVAPRGPGGVNPGLNGVWQAIEEANYDIECSSMKLHYQSVILAGRATGTFV